MAIRMAGLVSQLDTDSIIRELMSAQSLKKTKIEGKKTKLEWKVDKWKTLNSKIYGLYTGNLSKVKTQGNYQAKKVTSSNESAVVATSNTTAAAGSHTIEVNKLASGQFVTGNKIDADSPVNKNTKLTSIIKTQPNGTVSPTFKEKERIEITVGTGSDAKTKTLMVGASTTVNDFVKTLQDAGLNASFDAEQQRFFISSKESGAKNQFSITTKTEDGNLSTAKQNLLNAVGAGNESAVNAFYDNYSKTAKELASKKDIYDNAMASGSGATPDQKVKAYDDWKKAEKQFNEVGNSLISIAKNAKEAERTNKAKEEVKKEFIINLKADPSSPEYKSIIDAVDKLYYKYDANGNKLNPPEYTPDALEVAENEIKVELRKQATEFVNNEIANGTVYPSDEARQQAIANKYQQLYDARMGTTPDSILTEIKGKVALLYEDTKTTAFENAGDAYLETAAGGQKVQQWLTNNNAAADITAAGAAVASAITIYGDELRLHGTVTENTNGLDNLGIGAIKEITTSLPAGGTTTEMGSTLGNVSFVKAQDAEILFDGAPLTFEKNNFTTAGITFDIKDTTTGPVTLNVTNNTKDSYDLVKNFVKSYNEVLMEMSNAYYAGSSKGYEPLTSEEKQAMTDEDVKNWETKIKDSLLRRDQTLGNLMTTMRTSLQSSVTVDGKKYSLASFGIGTSEDWTERGLLHIKGDSDDPLYASDTNKLQKAIEADPELVGKVISQITTDLYDTLQKKMGTSSLSSALTFYNDKQMKKQIDSYEDDIKIWEQKLEDMENRYYKQFSAMEVALSKLNSQSSSLSGLLGS